MNRIGIVSCDVWDKAEFRKMTCEGKLVTLYVWTFQKRNNSGIYRETPQSLSALAPMPQEAFMRGFQEAISAGFVFFDQDNSVILVNNHAKWCPPYNPNIVRSWKNMLSMIPKASPLKKKWVEQTFSSLVKSVSEGKNQAFLDAFENNFAVELGIGKEDQEPEYEPEEESSESESDNLEPEKEKPVQVVKIQRRPKVERLTDEEFIMAIKANKAYSHFSVDDELAKMDAWLSANPGRNKTRKFIVNWLNKIQRPVVTNGTRRPNLTRVGQRNMDAVEDAMNIGNGRPGDE